MHACGMRGSRWANRCEFYNVSDVTDSEQYPVGPPLFGSMQDK